MTLQVNGKTIPPVAIGTWAWGTGMNGSKMIFGTVTDKSQLKGAFESAINNGFDLWDTAAVYGFGNAEKILGECMCIAENQVILSTKYTPGKKASFSKIEQSLKDSMERLGTEIPDIYWLHMPVNIEENIKNLIKLLKAGKIASIGVSNFNMEQLKKAEGLMSKEGYHIAGVQNHYSLLYRGSEKAGIIKWCKEKNIPFFAYMVLEQGALTGRYNSQNKFPTISRRNMAFPKKKLQKLELLHKELESVGNNHGLTISQTTIAWAIAKGAIPLVGVTKSYQAEELAALKEINLTEEEVTKLDEKAAETGVEVSGSWEKKVI